MTLISLRSAALALAVTGAAPLGAQMASQPTDSTRTAPTSDSVRTPAATTATNAAAMMLPPITIQHLRPRDQRGIN
ncbi:MAG TPA: hypothetical protein VGT98_10260, partial [Candidatus Elarobacter sp.]|nr:hypothetical protein [Candidatus Elarobacter sp.]